MGRPAPPRRDGPRRGDPPGGLAGPGGDGARGRGPRVRPRPERRDRGGLRRVRGPAARLACLPLHDARAAVAELDRSRAAGLLGVEIGTRVGERDLDDPSLDPVWAALAATGSAVLVHPVDEGRGVLRRTGPPYDLGLGMLADTALAAGALVFGGVLERHPDLRVALAHGCGAFPWAYPRLRVAAARGGVTGDPARRDELVRLLYADTLVFDDEHLRLLVHRFGPGRLLLGSDAPFFPDQMALSIASVERARSAAVLPPGVDLTANALAYLGLPGPG
ncbi:amidohydrolase family protein [Pseudonocardia petroleophila]|uniref:Amidohydrolase family protein n=1 Tax=Pseudonocardia petroleophila TaxID=37331 RepID=A0A7G7MEV7_9PSEU|nr:amidohydrolase family protein [Pseudonocardia petroleophila]QNG51318.1 amidohydrolase family protein [Pseudonocardia petroleophila]